MRTSVARPAIPTAGAALALCLLALGCGSAGKQTGAARGPASIAAVAAQPAVATTATVPARVRILTPASGAHTVASLTVRVALSGAAPGGARALRYVLDGSLARSAGLHLTYRELAPGRHHLVVLFAREPRVRASASFTVRAPAPPAPAATTEQMHSAPEAATALAKAPSPPPKAPAPEPTHPSTEHTAPPPPAEEAIPQGNGGDHDSGNNGGPSDGDGNV
jgi:hypothetical protein